MEKETKEKPPQLPTIEYEARKIVIEATGDKVTDIQLIHDEDESSTDDSISSMICSFVTTVVSVAFLSLLSYTCLIGAMHLINCPSSVANRWLPLKQWSQEVTAFGTDNDDQKQPEKVSSSLNEDFLEGFWDYVSQVPPKKLKDLVHDMEDLDYTDEASGAHITADSNKRDADYLSNDEAGEYILASLMKRKLADSGVLAGDKDKLEPKTLEGASEAHIPDASKASDDSKEELKDLLFAEAENEVLDSKMRQGLSLGAPNEDVNGANANIWQRILQDVKTAGDNLASMETQQNENPDQNERISVNDPWVDELESLYFHGVGALHKLNYFDRFESNVSQEVGQYLAENQHKNASLQGEAKKRTKRQAIELVTPYIVSMFGNDKVQAQNELKYPETGLSLRPLAPRVPFQQAVCSALTCCYLLPDQVALPCCGLLGLQFRLHLDCCRCFGMEIVGLESMRAVS